MTNTLHWQRAAVEAERVVRREGITALPVDPRTVAQHFEITVVRKPAASPGVSGMLVRLGSNFVISYATHIANVGFQNFSIAHELGHYFLAGHVDAVFDAQGVHASCAGFRSRDKYELEADHFAAALLMPRALFEPAMQTAGTGLSAMEKLAERCRASLTATAIRYARITSDAVAVVQSQGPRIDYCFLSEALKDALQDIEGTDWIRKGQALDRDTATSSFNQDDDRIAHGQRWDDTCEVRDWFGGECCLEMEEEVVGLGSYGKTLTVLTAPDLEQQIAELEEAEELRESWTPRFRRR